MCCLCISMYLSWEELRDGRELAEYTMSIAYDPTRRKNLMPGAIARR
jgi:hypothetical protein